MATAIKTGEERESEPLRENEVPVRKLSARDSALFLQALKSNDPPGENLKSAAEKFKQRHSR